MLLSGAALVESVPLLSSAVRVGAVGRGNATGAGVVLVDAKRDAGGRGTVARRTASPSATSSCNRAKEQAVSKSGGR